MTKKIDLQTTNLPKASYCTAGVLFDDDPYFVDHPESSKAFVKSVNYPASYRRIDEDYLAGKLKTPEYCAGHKLIGDVRETLRGLHRG